MDTIREEAMDYVAADGCMRFDELADSGADIFYQRATAARFCRNDAPEHSAFCFPVDQPAMDPVAIDCHRDAP